MKMLLVKVQFYFLCIIVLGSVSYGQERTIPVPDYVMAYHFNKHVVYKNLTYSGSKKSRIVAKGKSLGETDVLPFIRSEKFNNEIYKSFNLYNNREYKAAAEALENVYPKEPENPFLLEPYARALYRINREKSFSIYKQLVAILDLNIKKGAYVSVVKNGKDLYENKYLKELKLLWKQIDNKYSNSVKVDLWFSEAYWKLGTLYLDKGMYLEGAYEISRFLVIFSGQKRDSKQDLFLREQALSYLTESCFHLKSYNLSRYFAQETLKINPENKYVIPYLDSMNKNKK